MWLKSPLHVTSEVRAVTIYYNTMFKQLCLIHYKHIPLSFSVSLKVVLKVLTVCSMNDIVYSIA